MGAAKPTLGYPSRTAAVHGLRSEGLTTAAIAAKIGIKKSTVSALEGSGQVRKMPRPDEALGRIAVIPVDILNALGPHAAKRNISVNHLARLIISTVVDEGMVDAVMDDASELDWSF